MTKKSDLSRLTVNGLSAKHLYFISMLFCGSALGILLFLLSSTPFEDGKLFAEKYQADPAFFAIVTFSEADLKQIDPDALSGIALWEGTGPASLMNAFSVAACIERADGTVSTLQMSRPDDGFGKVSVFEGSRNDSFAKPLVEAGICQKAMALTAS